MYADIAAKFRWDALVYHMVCPQNSNEEAQWREKGEEEVE